MSSLVHYTSSVVHCFAGSVLSAVVINPLGAGCIYIYMRAFTIPFPAGCIYICSAYLCCVSAPFFQLTLSRWLCTVTLNLGKVSVPSFHSGANTATRAPRSSCIISSCHSHSYVAVDNSQATRVQLEPLPFSLCYVNSNGW